MLKNLLLFSSICLIVFSSLAQTQKTCGFDEIHKELLKARPEFKEKIESSELKFQEFAKNYKKRNGVYKIPVVVHVMETGSSLTSITDQQIQNAIKELNEKYRKIPNSIGDGNGVDVTIEFALAVRDPYGKCTNGINRFDMSGVASYVSNGVKRSTSGITDQELKSYISWNQTKYYNIWLVSEMDNNEGGGGTQGYAYFSDSHGASWDGAVILVNAFKDPNNNTCSHELGHAFNLYHSFEGDMDASGNAICPPNSDCTTQGDKVCDTPPHKRTNGNCVSGTNSCDNNSSNDNFMHNYMDYSSDECANEFTAGQKVRMIAAMTVNRGSFLESNGNLSLVPVSEPTLDFTSTSEYVCTGNTVTLYDQSTCIPNTYINGAPWSAISYNWLVKSGVTELTSTAQTPTFTLTTPGTYDITMNVTTVLGTYSYTKKGAIVVGAATKNASCTPNSNYVGNYWHTINNVTFNTLNKITNSYLNEGYKNFTCEKTTMVAPGKSYPFSVSLRAANNNYSEFVEAYIDYNNNGTFETTELIYSGSIPPNTTSTLSSMITIPSDAVKDQPLRLRVIGEAGTTGSTTSISSAEKSCTSNFFIGDVEDYTVYISSKTASVSLAVAPSSTITYGTAVTFTATAVNQGTAPIYEWYVNNVKISGNSSSTFTSSSLLANDVVKCVLISNLSGVTNSPATSNSIKMNVTGVPLSNFSVSKTTPCTGESITFNDLSMLSPTSWAWTFEGGNPSSATTKNPVVSYATPGTYKVTLIASNSLGTGTTYQKTNYITVYGTPSNSCSSITRANDPSQYGIGLAGVELNDILTASGFNDAAFQDFSCSKKTFLQPNTNYPITVKTGSYNTQWVRVYIDYNGDGDFLDAGELVFSPTNGKGTFSGSITTPSNPILKDKILRMRVITDYADNISPSSCRSLSYGQAEDFGIVFRSSNCQGLDTPTFNAVSAICSGQELAALPTTSTNNISGTWSPAIDNTTTTTYTFTPSANQCGTTTTMTINVNPSANAGTISGVDTLCIGSPVVFTTSGTGGTWAVQDGSVATIDQQGKLTGVASGITTVNYSVTSSNGCNSVGSKSIQIINGLEVSSASAVCIGSTTTLVPSIAGGTWSIVSGATNVTLANGIVTGKIAGSATIGYTIANNLAGGCLNSINKTITVNALPSAGTLGGALTTTGKFAVCPTTTRTSTSTVAGGVWTSSNTAIATVTNNGVVTGVATGSTTINYTVTNPTTGCSNKVTRTVIVDAKPATPIIYGTNIMLCQSGKAFLTASLPNGIWSANDSYLKFSTLNNGMFFQQNVIPSDNYVSGVKYSLFSTNRACTSEGTKEIILRKVAQKAVTISASTTNLIVNQEVTATATTSMTVTGVWRSFLPTALSVTVNPSINKQATVKGLAPGTNGYIMFQAKDPATGCSNGGWLSFNVTASASIVDVLQTTPLTNVRLYPNPSNGRFTIENTDGSAAVKLVDLTGRVIATQSILAGTSTVDFSGIATGKYMLHISGDSINEVQPIVIE